MIIIRQEIVCNLLEQPANEVTSSQTMLELFKQLSTTSDWKLQICISHHRHPTSTVAVFLAEGPDTRNVTDRMSHPKWTIQTILAPMNPDCMSGSRAQVSLAEEPSLSLHHLSPTAKNRAESQFSAATLCQVWTLLRTLWRNSRGPILRVNAGESSTANGIVKKEIKRDLRCQHFILGNPEETNHKPSDFRS